MRVHPFLLFGGTDGRIEQQAVLETTPACPN
jgi:hypothetical protein